MFCWLRFKFVFHLIFFLRPYGIPFGTIFQKNKTLPKIGSKKEDPLLENESLWRGPGAPRDAASYYSYKGRRLAGALNSVQFNSIQAQFNSNSIQIELELEMAVRVGFEMRTIARKWLLELASIAKVSKTIRKKGKGWYRKFSNNWKRLLSKLLASIWKRWKGLLFRNGNYWWSDTPTGPRPGEFSSFLASPHRK